MADSTVNYGFPFPTGGDQVAVHSDIAKVAQAVDARELQTNLRVDGAFAAAEDARFDFTGAPLGAASDLDALRNGSYSIWSGVVADALGLPAGTAGTFQSFKWGASGGVQMWFPRVLSGVQLWMRNKLSGGWTEWTQVGADSGSTNPVPPNSSASGYKTVPLSVTRGNGGGGRGPAEATVRIPLTYNAEVTRWRVRIVDGNPRFNLRKTTGFRIASMKFGGRDGAAITDAVEVMSATTNPAGNTAGIVSPWVSAPLNGEHFLQIAYDQTSDTPIDLVGGCYVNPSPTAGDGASGFTRSVSCPFDIWIEAETPASTPTVAVLGDSNSVGVGTTLPVHDSYLSIYCRRIGALPVHYGHSGDTYANFENPDQDKWNRWKDLAPVDAVIQMLGSNDVSGGPGIDEMKRRYQVVTDIAVQKISPVVHVGLLKPRTSGDAAYQSLRVAFNNFLRTVPNPARALHDLSSPVANAADDAILPQFDSDGTHMTTAGHQALADSITTPITTSPGGSTEVTYVGDGVYEIG